MIGDEELIEDLRKLVSPPHREPPGESVAALHAAIAGKFPSQVKRPWWRQKLTVGAAVFGLVAGTPAAGFALTGSPLPSPLRTAMHAVLLPVDSVPVADTKAAERDLEEAIRDHIDAEITRAAAHLRACLANLDPGDRARLAPRADSLLETAADIEGDADNPSASGQGGPGEEGGSDVDHPSSQQSQPGSSIDSQTRDGSNTSTRNDGGDIGSGDNNSSTPTTTAGPSTATSGSSGDGDQTSTTTVAPSQTQTDGDGGTSTTTTTTVQGGGGDGGSSG